MKLARSTSERARSPGAGHALELILTVTLLLMAGTSRAGEEVALVALGAEAELVPQVQAVGRKLHETGRVVLDDDELSRRLRGVPANCPGPAANDAVCYRDVDEDAANALLKEASKQEASFDLEAADARRRQVVELFDAAPRPSARLRLLAGEAAVAVAASAFSAGRLPEAEAAALDAMRRFGDTPIDARRYAPRLQQLFAEARASLAAQPQVELRVRSTAPGRLFAEAGELGVLVRELVVRLPPGRYRLWVQSEAGELSLPYAVELHDAPVAVELDPELDRDLGLGRPATLACQGARCEELLVRLCARLGVDHAVGVGTAPSPAARVLRVGREGSRQWVPLERAASPDGFLAPLAGSSTPTTARGWRRHRWSLGLAAAGLVALGVGAGFGLRSRDQLESAGAAERTQLEHDGLNAAGRRNALVADGCFVVAGTALTAALLVLRAEW